ncbi:MAG: bifunctional nuclease family protein [Candidatus Yanofskybacteria bacterium]|nr:bifunctional nuclease family protein [Candidatus Yanofskybacteria bacterium]
MEILFKIVAIGRHAQTGEPLIVLHEVSGSRQLNMYFGEEVVALIRAAAQQVKHTSSYEFPVCHGLTVHLLKRFDVRVERVAIVPNGDDDSMSVVRFAQGNTRWTQNTSDADGIAIAAATGCDLAIDERVCDMAARLGNSEERDDSPDLEEATRRVRDDDDLPKA